MKSKALFSVVPLLLFAVASLFGAIPHAAMIGAGALPFVSFGTVTSDVDLATFEVAPQPTAMAIAYHNEECIADEIFPRFPVAAELYSYREYPMADVMTIPDTSVGRKGDPNLVEFGFTLKPGMCKPYGLGDIIPVADIQNAPPNDDPVSRSTIMIMNLVELDRENRVATYCQNPANFAGQCNNNTTYNSSSNNGATCPGTIGGIATPAGVQFSIKWSDLANADPLAELISIMDTMVHHPNHIMFSRNIWSVFKQHPAVIKKLYGVASHTGVAEPGDVADKLDLGDASSVLVGSAWKNTNKKGQATSLARIWHDSVLLWYEDGMPSAAGSPTFGITAQWGTRIAGTIPGLGKGLKGAVTVIAGEYVNEQIVAPKMGYLLNSPL